MRDGLGNKLEEGQLLYWQKLGTTVRVLRVNENRIQSIGGSPPLPQSIAVELIIGVPAPQDQHGKPDPNHEPVLTEFLRVVDPQQERMLERAIGGRRQ